MGNEQKLCNRSLAKYKIVIARRPQGRRTGSTKILRKIANIMNVDLDDLVSPAS